MLIESTIQPSAIAPKNVPVVILALARPSSHPHIPSVPAAGTPAVFDRAFVSLPETYMALRTIVCVTFSLPLHSGLSFTTNTLSVCRGEAIRITENAYPVMKDVLDVIRVEVVPLEERERAMWEEKEEQELERVWGAPRAEVEETDEDQEEYGEEEEREELEYVDVPATNSGREQQSKQPLSVVSSNARARKQSQGTHVLSAKPATAKPRASLPAAAAGSASASGSPVPPSRHPSPAAAPLTTPPAADPPKDLRFKIYISGPASPHHAEFMTRGAHPVRKVLSAACKTFGVEYNSARLMLTNPNDDSTEEEETLCPTQMTMGDCGVMAGSRLVVRCNE
ncbi:hypothetical protein BD779DRAFT_1674581 [Infundibulicybe gibba]|nr:hypothetical protein BD779DRAFT_1674581 [Infundibulicybe gibba]